VQGTLEMEHEEKKSSMQHKFSKNYTISEQYAILNLMLMNETQQ